MKKIIFFLFFAAACALLGRQIYKKVSEKQEAPPKRESRGVAVEVKPVARGMVRQVVDFTGNLIPKSEFTVAPKIPGRLEKLLVDIGDSVKKGDLIAVLDSDEYTQQAAQAKAELEVSRANLADSKSSLDVASQEYERAKELRAQGISAQSDLDEAEAGFRAAEAKYAVAEAQIKQKEAALGAAEVRLSYTRIQASWESEDESRTVAERFVHEGAMLRANDPIVSIVDLESVLAVINVIERDFPEIRTEQTAVITTDAYGDRQFQGKVVRRAPVLKEESRQARVEVEISNPEGLLAPGMFVRVRIELDEHPNTIVVPIEAIVRRDDRQGVFLADTKALKARFVPVQVGIIEMNKAEILDSTLEGEVVTLGQHLLEDGASIVLPKSGTDEEKSPSSTAPGDAKGRRNPEAGR